MAEVHGPTLICIVLDFMPPQGGSMTEKELRAFVEKLVRDADVLRGRELPSHFIDAVYRRLIDFRAKAQAERHLYYLGRHLSGRSSAANPL